MANTQSNCTVEKKVKNAPSKSCMNACACQDGGGIPLGAPSGKPTKHSSSCVCVCLNVCVFVCVCVCVCVCLCMCERGRGEKSKTSHTAQFNSSASFCSLSSLCCLFGLLCLSFCSLLFVVCSFNTVLRVAYPWMSHTLFFCMSTCRTSSFRAGR